MLSASSVKAVARSSSVRPQRREACGVGTAVGNGSMEVGSSVGSSVGSTMITVGSGVSMVGTGVEIMVGRSVSTGAGVFGVGLLVGLGFGRGVGRGVGLLVVGKDMACVIRVQNSMSSVSSLCLLLE